MAALGAGAGAGAGWGGAWDKAEGRRQKRDRLRPTANGERPTISLEKPVHHRRQPQLLLLGRLRARQQHVERVALLRVAELAAGVAEDALGIAFDVARVDDDL